MQFFPFRAVGTPKPFPITYAAIAEAMKAAKTPAGRKYAVMDTNTGKTFSPKEIIRLIIGQRSFSGGKGINGANRVFQVFGFPVGKLDDLKKRRKAMGRNLRVPPTKVLLKQLFSGTWRVLPSKAELKNINDGGCPGVYILAYSETNLQGRRVRESDVFYVGMTCEGGLSNRLQQFREGIENGRCHSAANRFYAVWLRRKRYNPQDSTRFYFAYVPVHCETAKPWRSAADINTLSKVPELELAAIARVKNHLHHEPLLNKK